MAISMLKIRRPLGRLIFNMGIAIHGKTVFLIETAPRLVVYHSHALLLKLDLIRVSMNILITDSVMYENTYEYIKSFCWWPTI